MAGKPIVACKRCKTKKLKCDDEPKSCKNCSRVEMPCIHVDSRSRREYARGYVEELEQRRSHLRSILESRVTPRPLQTERTSSGSPATRTTYHGEGSVISMARLVEATVADTTVETSPLNVELESAREQHQALNTTASPAILPSMETAQQLFASYLNGPHLLHPFLSRSTLLRELDDVYSKRCAQSDPCVFRIYMIFAIGAVSLVRAGMHDVSPLDYYAAAMEHTGGALGLAGLEHVQALLLVLLFSLQHDIGIGSKWDLARVAMRICIENRFHKKSSYQYGPMEDQIRRRAFWACYIVDRHSCSVLGRPMGIRDEDIDVELPLDVDDDLIELGSCDVQILRGMSEVSAQLRQIRLRQITSRIGTRLYRRADRDFDALKQQADEILLALDQWRASFPILPHARNAYETMHWRDLNYHRERLKCFRFFGLIAKECGYENGGTALEACRQASAQIALIYQAMRQSDTLIMNWTCVHDMMSVGFTILYCGLAQQKLALVCGGPAGSLAEHFAEMQEIVAVILDTLSHIAEKWVTVGRHVRVFKAVAARVVDTLDVRLAVDESGPGAMNASRPSGEVGTDSRENHFGHEADVWDAAMVAFLNEPTDLGNIPWGVIDWDSMVLPRGAHQGAL